MGLASALGQTFNFPQQGRQQSQMQQQAAQQAGGSIIGAPPTGLENVEGVTQAFYDKWGQLESFASDMKMQYGIDVTRPDFSSKEGMEAHKMYQQAIADLRYSGNALKQSQKDLDVYNKARTSAYGQRVGYDGSQGQGLFDPNQITMEDPYRSPASQKETFAEWKRKQDYSQGLKNKTKEAKDAASKESYAYYGDLAEKVATIGAGDIKFTIDEETGRQVSDMLNGAYFGTKAKSGKISGIERRDGKLYLQYGDIYDDGSSEGEIEIRDDTMPEIYGKLIVGEKGSTGAETGAEYLKFMADKNQDPFATNSDGSLAKKAEDESTVFYNKTIDSRIKELKNIADKASSDQGKTELEELVGLADKDGRVVEKIEKRWGTTTGKYLIFFEGVKDGVAVGGDAGNLDIIKDILSSKKKGELQQPKEIFSPDPNATYIIDGVEYSLQELQAFDGYSEDILMKSVKDGTYKIK